MSKSRDLADSAATINFIDGVTSAVQTQINAKGVGSVTSVAVTGAVNGITITGGLTWPLRLLEHSLLPAAVRAALPLQAQVK